MRSWNERRRGKPVQQDDRRLRWVPGLAVEDPEAYNVGDLEVHDALRARALLPQRLEARAHLRNEERRLLPSREVAAFGELVEVDELRIRLFRPVLRGGVQLVGKDAHRD